MDFIFDMHSYLLTAISLDGPLIFAALFCGIVLGLALSFFISSEIPTKRLWVLLAGVSILGAVAGVSGGTSRVGVVGDVIPAALALVGGVAVYLFGAEDRSRGEVAAVCAVAFATSLGIGYASGAQARMPREIEETYARYCREKFADAALLGSDKAYCRFISNMGENCAYYIALDLSSYQSAADDRNDAYQANYYAILQNMKRTISDTDPICDFIIWDRDGGSDRELHFKKLSELELPRP